MATHGVLSDPAIDRLKNSPISRVVVTDTLPAAAREADRQARGPLGGQDHRRRHRRRVRGHARCRRSSAAKTRPDAAARLGFRLGPVASAAMLGRPSSHPRSACPMAEITLVAEPGRPTGSAASPAAAPRRPDPRRGLRPRRRPPSPCRWTAATCAPPCRPTPASTPLLSLAGRTADPPRHGPGRCSATRCATPSSTSTSRSCDRDEVIPPRCPIAAGR